MRGSRIKARVSPKKESWIMNRQARARVRPVNSSNPLTDL